MSNLFVDIRFPNGTSVPYTPANAVLFMLYDRPGYWIHACRILRCRRTAGIMRLARAAEAIREIDPLLAATLRDVQWRGEWAMLNTAYRKM